MSGIALMHLLQSRGFGLEMGKTPGGIYLSLPADMDANLSKEGREQVIAFMWANKSELLALLSGAYRN